MDSWQDISTAPRDGTAVRLRGEKHAPPELFWWRKGKWRTTLYAPLRKVEAWWDESLDPIKEWSFPAPPGR